MYYFRLEKKLVYLDCLDCSTFKDRYIANIISNISKQVGKPQYINFIINKIILYCASYTHHINLNTKIEIISTCISVLKQYKIQGDRDDAQEINAFWKYYITLNENHCQTNISKGRRGKALILFSWMR